MKKLRTIRFLSLALVLAAGTQGCLGPAPERPVQWLVEAADAADGAADAAGGAARTVRLVRLNVLAPYDRTAIAVLRRDGSVAFDACNAFAAAPSALLRDAALAALRRGGAVVPVCNESIAVADEECEILMRRLALDCRAEGRRVARVELTVNRFAGSRRIAASLRGEGECDAADGNYSRAFSRAFAAAMERAWR